MLSSYKHTTQLQWIMRILSSISFNEGSQDFDSCFLLVWIICIFPQRELVLVNVDDFLLVLSQQFVTRVVTFCCQISFNIYIMQHSPIPTPPLLDLTLCDITDAWGNPSWRSFSSSRRCFCVKGHSSPAGAFLSILMFSLKKWNLPFGWKIKCSSL